MKKFFVLISGIMRVFKRLAKKILGHSFYGIIVDIKHYHFNLMKLIGNGFIDIIMYYKHSAVFHINTFNKVEAQIILHYHGIEKGFLHDEFRFRFGEERVRELIRLLNLPLVKGNYKKTQIAAAYLSVCKYYELHSENNIDLSDFYEEKDFKLFKSLSTLKSGIVKHHNKKDYFSSRFTDFESFSKSRVSIRKFTGEMVPIDLIGKAIELSSSTPSVCNRQPTKVYYVDSKSKIDRIFDIQKGLKGYSEGIKQLLVLVSDRNYFYTIGERNQMYIDGGMFLMNLLYALHFYEIGACPAHWGLNYSHDIKIRTELGIRKSEKVICLIPIGVPNDNFLSTLSLRRESEEILFTL